MFSNQQMLTAATAKVVKGQSASPRPDALHRHLHPRRSIHQLSLIRVVEDSLS